MRWTTSLLLLLGAVFGLSSALDECNAKGLPPNDLECYIKSPTQDDKRALAICREFFPNLFVKGTVIPGQVQIKCEVQSKCPPDQVMLEDKQCYIHNSVQDANQARALCQDNFPSALVKGTIMPGENKIKCEIQPLCTHNEVPMEDIKCWIKWRVHNDKQALAVCLEHFPTTFVKGTRVEADNTIKCEVQAAYQCAGKHKDESFLMFDKCYYFPKTATGEYVKGTIEDYTTHTTDKSCPKDHKLSVFYSHTNAKFVGMKAHKLGIDKLWIGINKEGKSIKGTGQPDLMIHSKMWKLVEGDYWDGDELKKIDEKDPSKPDKSTHYFMRTITDYLMNRWQGSFEQAVGNKFEATFACETEAKFNDRQQWYCDKLKDGLGLDAVFDPGHDGRHEPPRCMYVSSRKYAFDGTHKGMPKGCKESPSELHSAAMDDGGGGWEHYKKFQNNGPLRIAAYRIDRSDTEYVGSTIKEKGQGADTDRFNNHIKWRHISHHGRIQSPVVATMAWTRNYPSNQDSDFPGASTTMALKNGEKVDLPPEVRAYAICSIWFFQQCENLGNPCRGNATLPNYEPDLWCTNQRTYHIDEYHRDKSGFFTCDCPKPTGDIARSLPANIPYKFEVVNNIRTCTWHNPDMCAYMDHVDKNTGNWMNMGSMDLRNNEFKRLNADGNHADTLQQVVVRKGCRFSAFFNSHHTTDGSTTDDGYKRDLDTMLKVPDGVYEVPNEHNQKCHNWPACGALGAKCWCP